VHADQTAEAGRLVLEKYQEAVIKVKLVIRFKLLMNGSEMKNNIAILNKYGWDYFFLNRRRHLKTSFF